MQQTKAVRGPAAALKQRSTKQFQHILKAATRRQPRRSTDRTDQKDENAPQGEQVRRRQGRHVDRFS